MSQPFPSRAWTAQERWGSTRKLRHEQWERSGYGTMDLDSIREIVNLEIAGGLTVAELEQLAERVAGLRTDAEKLLTLLPAGMEQIEPAPAVMIGEMDA